VKAMKLAGFSAALVAAVVASGCGEVARSGRAPVQVVVMAIEGASGAEPDEFGTNLSSDVVTIVQRTVEGEQVGVPTIFGDGGRVTMRLVMKDPGVPGAPTAPSNLNAVTFTRYRVAYRRTDGRNTPGVDVPYGFDSAATFTVGGDEETTAGFTLVRVIAKQEAPLAGLASNPMLISTIADITFYGRDQAGNDVMATGSIGVTFGNFGDPE
jgi:hypothetical protein